MTLPAPDRPSAAGRRRRWLPPGLWATGLVVATSWPSPDVPDVGQGDKLVHALMYAGLAALVVRALSPASRRPRRLAAVVAAVSAFGAADEWHQQFIPGRSASAADWVADSVGGALGVLGAVARRRTQPA